MTGARASVSARIGVLAVQGAVAEHRVALERVGARSCRVREASDLEHLDGLIVPGGESTTMALVGGQSGLLEALRGRVAAGLPVFGTCAGLIALADEVVGGRRLIGGLDVVVRRNAYGRQAASFEAAIEVRGIAGPAMTGVFIRAPRVERCGPVVEVLAGHAGHPVVVRHGALLASAFHPELTADARLHALFLATVVGNPGSHDRAEGDARVGTQ